MTGDINLTLDRLDAGQGVNQHVTVARGGRFRFENVQPGSWLLWAVGTKPMIVAATSSGGQQRAGNIVTTRERSLELAVTLSQSETRIEGVAQRDGKGIAGVMVVLLPRDSGAWRSLTRRDQSDTDGSFTLRDVAPGQYTLVVIEDGWTLEWTRPEVMAHYLPRGKAISVTANTGNLLRLESPIVVQTR